MAGRSFFPSREDNSERCRCHRGGALDPPWARTHLGHGSTLGMDPPGARTNLGRGPTLSSDPPWAWTHLGHNFCDRRAAPPGFTLKGKSVSRNIHKNIHSPISTQANNQLGAACKSHGPRITFFFLRWPRWIPIKACTENKIAIMPRYWWLGNFYNQECLFVN